MLTNCLDPSLLILLRFLRWESRLNGMNYTDSGEDPESLVTKCGKYSAIMWQVRESNGGFQVLSYSTRVPHR